MVRISLGAYNTMEEIDTLVDMLWRITQNDYHGQYDEVPEYGEYKPADYQDPTLGCCSFMGSMAKL